MTYSIGPEGYAGNLSDRCATIPEVLKTQGYRSYMSGKWHIAADLEKPNGAWPTQRGFDKFFGTIIGAGSFYHPNTLTRGLDSADRDAVENPDFFYTDAISDEAVGFVRNHASEYGDEPFFMYVAYTAPHWPLHAHEEDTARYKGRFDSGWDTLREERLARLVKAGLIDSSWQLTDRDPSQPPFEKAEEKAWMTRLMEVYAAQIDRMDQGIGRILDALDETGKMNDTIIIFLSDNGGCAEDIPENVDPKTLVEDLKIAQYQTRDGRPVRIGNDPSIMPGNEDTYQSYGIPWANLSNTPFRLYKHFTHEGGIATPLIVHWPGHAEAGGIRHVPGQLPDIMATILEVTGAVYPSERAGQPVPPCEGVSLAPSFKQDTNRAKPLFWEHEGNAAMREGRWKLVRRFPGPWELFDMKRDRTEMNNMAARDPERVERMAADWRAWADRCGVISREKILEILKHQDVDAFWEEET